MCRLKFNKVNSASVQCSQPFVCSAYLTLGRKVIVGTNGSGKSTVLKLMLRLYDPTEGMISVNDQDIRTLKLADLHESMAVLFQDYTHFPLSVSSQPEPPFRRVAADTVWRVTGQR